MKKHILTSFVLFTLVGCSGGTAECNDDSIKDTVKQIIESEMQKAVWGKELYEEGTIKDTFISNVKTTSYDEKMDFYTCAAKYSFDFRGHERNKEITYELSYLEDLDDTEVGVYGVTDVRNELLGLIMIGSR